MLTKVQKWGNSMAIRIPKAFAEELGMQHDSEVELFLVHGKLIVKPVRPVKHSLEELLAKVKDETIHGETSTDESVGREVW